MNDWPEDGGYGRGSANSQPEGPRRMSHVQRPQVPQQPPRHDQGFNQGSQGYNPNFTQAQNAGYDSGYSSGQVYGGPQGGGRGTVPPQDRKSVV